ncbi:TrkH family potassium uptake protein [Myxococcota bacterium]|nr:TrkH family potassium uptake protein [Myxococcota bacterium]MBU1896454.1 TrkH family potassium uptake protein [Myxococcota bacterium]
MRLALLIHLTGVLTLLLAAAMLPSLLLALHDQTPDMRGLGVAIGLSGLLGLILFIVGWLTTKKAAIGHREGFLIVGVGWTVAGLIGALPYWLYAHLAPGDICAATSAPLPIGYDFCSFTNAAFESISGFTTTGASILSDGLWADASGLTVEGRVGLPRGILLWRFMTHFLGGMGIIVLGVAILPLLGVGGMQLLKAEVPGPTTDKLAPRVEETARLLWKVYLIISIAMFLLLWIEMDWFEATCHTMATMATGGFSTRAASVMSFNSGYIEWIITLFMFIAGVNFTLHFGAVRARLRNYLRDAEFQVYAGIALITTLIAAVALYRAEESGMGIWEALRVSAFQIMTIYSTTGFASRDFELWTYAPMALLMLLSLMFVGGMAGSTGGGIKVIRLMVMTKLWVRELFLLSHPRAKRPVTFGGRVVEPDVLRATAAFIAAYFMLFVIGTLAFVLDGQDLLTASTCSIASLGNIGPGLGDIGPFDNYACLSAPAKWVSIELMLLGRLEVYTLLILLHPAFWRR